ncbi:CopG family antitoxin [Paenibacillus sp. HB172176]|uniref:CopG family antitoxin n=1 Tax=Paenibacillus sp. HB172176 TaxID=2493690 RepID=UPI001439B227|nr:CopG family antitoxin [Paenibacillus sp. HB172176]
MKIITSRDQIPEHMSDAEAVEFWSNHTMSEGLLEASIIEEEDHDLPKRKSATISIRLDDDLLQRIRTLAKQRNKGYQTLIKEFLIERAYEEEKKTPLIRKANLGSTIADQVTLEHQLERVFHILQKELSQLASGTIIVHIRNNCVGKFGIRATPVAEKNDLDEANKQGLTEFQQHSLLKQTIEALKYKTNWINGEIYLSFSLQHYDVNASIQFESNYNMPNPIVSKSKNTGYTPLIVKTKH